MLNLYKLEIFNRVAIDGSFSQAAEHLLLTQPAISQHIRDLEASLQSDLFVRGNRGVTLTPAGETLLDYTRCILRLVAEAESAVLAIDKLANAQIAVGATPGAGVYLLPEWIQSFHRRFPELATFLRTDTTANIAVDILSGKLDLGFVEGELTVEPPLSALILHEIELFVIVGLEHPWQKLDQIDLQELHGHPFITRPPGSQTRSWIDQLLAQHGVLPRVIAEFDNPEAIMQAVSSGMGVTILPAWGLDGRSAGARLHRLTIKNLTLRRMLKLIWNADTPFKPVSRAFLSQLADEFPQLTQIVASDESLELHLPRRDEYKASLNCVNSSVRNA
jgi:DNA-binding transcriptional LysR family regulator